MAIKFQIGDHVYTRDPSSHIEGASCIIGDIDEIVEINGELTYRFNAEVPVKRAAYQYETQTHRVSMRAHEIGLRNLGIPISQLDGNAMNRHANPGAWDRWVAISQSWENS